jgi:hypothetical protein
MFYNPPYVGPPQTKFGAWWQTILITLMMFACQAILIAIFAFGAHQLLLETSIIGNDEFYNAVIMAVVGLSFSVLWPIMVWGDAKASLIVAWNFGKDS